VTAVPYSFLSVRRDGPVEHLTLNRPDVRNAFNEQVIGELTAWAARARGEASLRAVVLRGAGPAFSAGADAAWMARMAEYSHDENVEDARRMAEMFFALNTLPAALVGVIHGAALGGGAGLAAVCDIAIADETAIFGFTETKLGILPAVIAPYVLPKIGPSAARDLFLTGRRFSAARAREIGLVHDIVPASALEGTVKRYLDELLGAAPSAIAASKALIQDVWGQRPAEVLTLTADTIAAQRASPEGQEGLRAFLAKRRPRWAIDA
jgi:methylglutaconyl-CoA hydratase